MLRNRAFVHLLEDHHSPQRGIISPARHRESRAIRTELIEIDPACNRFPVFVAAVPIRRFRPSGIVPCRLMSQVELTHYRALCIINGERHIGGIGEVIRYPCLRVERVGVVGQQALSLSVSTRRGVAQGI